MNNIKFYFKTVICVLFMFSCGGKDAETKASPDVRTDESPVKKNIDDVEFSDDLNIDRNMPEIVEDLRRDIKNLRSELDYQNENLSKLEAQSQIWANPFAIYNKEIVLNNGSSILRHTF